MGYLCGGPFNKDPSLVVSILGSTLGSILGSPYFGKLPNIFLYFDSHPKGFRF